MAIKILKMKPLMTKPKNLSQGSTPKIQSNPTTVTVSINWEEKVEKLFLTQSIFPFVTRFQK